MTDTSERQMPTTGFFVDWDGDIRRVENPGDGYRAEVVQRTGYLGVDVIDGGDFVAFEAVYYASVADLEKAGVIVVLAT